MINTALTGHSRKEDIKKLLFERCQTNRTNQYVHVYDIDRSVAESVRLRRVGIRDDINSRGQTHKYIDDVIDEMVADGLLLRIEQNSSTYVRSLNKTEQKKLKISICV